MPKLVPPEPYNPKSDPKPQGRYCNRYLSKGMINVVRECPHLRRAVFGKGLCLLFSPDELLGYEMNEDHYPLHLRCSACLESTPDEDSLALQTVM